MQTQLTCLHDHRWNTKRIDWDKAIRFYPLSSQLLCTGSLLCRRQIELADSELGVLEQIYKLYETMDMWLNLSCSTIEESQSQFTLFFFVND